MSIHDKKSLTYLDKKGTPEDPGPYWVAKFPWNIDPTELPDNKTAVATVMHVTEKKLQKNLEWRKIYELQLQTLVDKNYAVKITKDDIDEYVKLARFTTLVTRWL